MDYIGIPRGSIRGEALKRLAKLTVEHAPSVLPDPKVTAKRDQLDVLLSLASKEETVDKELSSVPISPKEYEVLIALADSTSFAAKFPPQVKLLLQKFRVYLLELPNQKFNHHVVVSNYESPPWAILAEKLTTALINIAYKFDKKYMDDVLNIFYEFNEKFFLFDAPEISNYFTLLGYIEALIKNSSILTESAKAFKIFLTVDTCIDTFDFLNDVEWYSNAIFKESNDYSMLLDREYIVDFSPVLYLEKLSRLMASILNSIVGNKDKPLLEYVLDKVSSKYANTGSERVPTDRELTIENLDISEAHMDFIKTLSSIATHKMEFLDRGETYIVYSTYKRLKLGYLAKAHNIEVISCGMFTDNVDLKSAKRFFKTCLQIKEVMLDPDLGLAALQLGSLLVFKDESVGTFLTRAFTSLVANPKLNAEYCVEASKCVGLASKILSQDALITTIYALTNLLFVGNDGLQLQSRNSVRRTNVPFGRGFEAFAPRDNNNLSRRASMTSVPTNGSRTNLSNRSIAGEYDEHDYLKVCENAVTSIIEISQACNDETVPTLAVTILSQKIAKLDTPIGGLLLRGLSACAPFLPEREFTILSKLLNRLSLDAFEAKNNYLLSNLITTRVDLSHKLSKDNPLFSVYLKEMLQAIISKGDVHVLEHHRSHNEISEIGEQIAIYLKPLAELLPNVNKGESPLEIKDTETINLFRNIWFNMVVHGYSINSKNAKEHYEDLLRIAYNTPPLASELSWDRTETSLELNTVLRRGSSNHNVKDHRTIIGDIFEVHRTLSYPKLMFLSATVFVESLRVKSGDCSTILHYYSDPSVKTSGVDKYIGFIAFKIVKDYVYLVSCGANKQFTSAHIAQQLTNMLVLCSHRLEELQDAALQCCDLLINKVPSSLCHHKSLFALFDILTLLFDSIIDAETHQYEPTTSYRAKRTGIHLSLSDSYKWRNETFDRFHEKSKHWVKLILLKSTVDVKSLIQSYVSEVDRFQSNKRIDFGVSFALEMAGSVLANDRELSNISRYPVGNLNTLPTLVSQLSWRSKFVSELVDKLPNNGSILDSDETLVSIRVKVVELRFKASDKTNHIENDEVIDLVSEIAGFTLITEDNSAELVRYLVEVPFEFFEPSIMDAAIGIWFAVMKDRPNLSMLLLSEIAKKWETTIQLKKGVFSRENDITAPEFDRMEYSPSDRKTVNRTAFKTSRSFEPHLQIIALFSSNFEATLNQSDHLLKLFTQFVEVGLKNLSTASLHPFARMVRSELIRFAFDVLNYHQKLGSRSSVNLTRLILNGTLSWFEQRSIYPFGGNILKFKADYGLLKEIARLVNNTSTYRSEELESKKTLLLFFLDDEISKISIWLDPLNPQETRGAYISHTLSANNITKAYKFDPILAVNLALRYKVKSLDETLQNLIIKNPLPAVGYADAVQFFIGLNAGTNMPSHHLLFWEPLSPIDAITLFLPPFGNNPFILQYTMRSLEHHDVNLTFFYVPQIVQSVRYDQTGYVERFIVETAKVSQLFAHQIIWNMKANSFKDEDSTEPDAIKPALDRIQKSMLSAFSQEDLQFYEKEFGFFNEVTSISGKLKPYIKKTKAEKKEKIDEEMYKIEVKPGVYLPSNPDGVVVDINRKSGKPLQSHAKAPFMASFKIKKDLVEVDDLGEVTKTTIEKWQGAIFKVGDDCRQDVLALQLISVFRTIWSDAGLDLYVFPYRVTATAPGCGVIDVLPNSTSRDMLGREAVNGLYEYFTTKFGPETSPEFQTARNNLIKSLAAYSIISFLLQFKDRHNGNIMYDDQGHILHIDFGFCFDIVPGGVKFEVAPFKLTHEMIMVLGGGVDTQAFKWFEELCVKGYLACRPYMETIVRCVNPMLESGLPCFKEATIKKLRGRFVPGKSEKEASLFFRGLIKKSMESFYTKGYDEFQRLTNGIPY
ncbi:phosphatidylinositol-4 kinase [Scheffersomyces xylosifermentans]|uniref:phosphatidylinositol-4 kinase n=1 Tax=Scheffersomyces xylosifermentans TaxID=1304137 RepID=UPI00315D5C09